MVKILLVDDDAVRTRTICACIDEKTHSKIDIASTQQDAFRYLAENLYDLLIVDIMLPENITTINPSETAGIELIDSIEKINKINKPVHIIGITSNPDVYSLVEEDFKTRLLPLFLWDPTNDYWKKQLLTKIGYIEHSKKELPQIDTVIITAVEDEYEAFKSLIENWETISLENDPCVYLKGNYSSPESENSILLVKLPTMGMTAASCVTTKVILKFSPKKVIMVGICGGIKGRVDLDDIIIASTSWDYGNGKILPDQFEAAPDQIPSSYSGFDKLSIASNGIINEIKNLWNSKHEDSPIFPKLHIGPLPSGASVVCDEKMYEDLIKQQHRKCLGLDMETYAVYFSAKNSVEKNISFLSVKCVSDFANSEKDDSHHKSCCFTSALFVLKCLEQNAL